VGQKREGVKKWLAENPMPFPFLIDEDRKVIKEFDVYHPFGIAAYKIAHPSTFLVNEEGKIVYAYVGENQADRPSDHVVYEKVHALLKNME
jgi:methyl-accepting chemotaxis protein